MPGISWLTKISWVAAVMLAAALLFVRAPAQVAKADEAPDPFFSMNTQFVQAGQTFTVAVQFGTNVGMRATHFDLQFDPAVVRVNSLQGGAFLSDFAQQVGGTTAVMSGAIDNVHGTVTGFSYMLVGAPGQAALGGGEIAVISFTALANGRTTALVTNAGVTDVNGNPIAGIVVTGGQIYVGPLPQLTVSALTLIPSGAGIHFGAQFDLNFTVSNIGGSAADPALATIAIDGAAPGLLTRTVPALGVNLSQSFVITGFQLLADQASVSVSVVGDGTRVATYRFTPVVSIGTTHVDAVFGAYLVLTPPGLINFGSMQLGQNQAFGTLNIKSNSGYEVDVFDSGATAWHLTAWDGAAVHAERLSDPLHVKYAPQGADVTAGTPQRLLTGTPAGQGTSDSGQDFPLTFTQGLHYADPLLPVNETYYLVLTFNAFVVL